MRLTNHLYSEGSLNYLRCCELLHQLLQAVVKKSWMVTRTSIIEFNVLMNEVNTQLAAFSTDVMTMERFGDYFTCIYTRYAVLVQGIEANTNVSYRKCLNQILAFLDIWFEKFPSLTTVESAIYRNRLILEAPQAISHPLTKDEPMFHSIMKSKNVVRHECIERIHFCSSPRSARGNR